MRKHLKTATGIVAAGLTITAFAISPASAAGRWGTNDPTCTTPSTTAGQMQYGAQGNRGTMNGMGNRGNMNGMGNGGTAVAMGTLTAAQKAELAFMAEEEKLAKDVYTALAARFPAVPEFASIARSETQHQASIVNLLARYGIANPTTGLAAGQFANAELQSLYTSLLARATTPEAALAVGADIERLDIADLKDAMSGLTAPDVLRVYGNLLRASERHLVAFTN